MKTWSAIFNFFAIWILILMMGVFYHHIDAIQTDYDTAVLRQVTEFAGEAAFNSAIVESGDIDMDYTNLGNVSLNPSESLKIFEDIVCLSYGMSINDKNRAYIESCIPSAIMCTYDGYYITQLMEDNMAELKWSIKIPYTIDVKNIAGKDYTLALRMDNEDCFVLANDTSNGLDTGYTSYNDDVWLVPSYTPYNNDAGGAGFQDSVLNKNIANAKINSTITDALSYSISQISECRGGKNYNYRVYLPADTTFTGINSVNGPSLIILLSGGDFAGKASVSEAAISGLKAVARSWVVGYKDNITGQRLYCYDGQLSNEAISSGTITVNDKPFSTVQDAAKAGYYPDYSRLTLPIKK